MARYIDADAMIEDLDTVNPVYKEMIEWAKRVVEAQPTADVVERKTAILNPTEVITWFEDINGHRNIVFKLPFAVTDVNTISIRLDGCNLQEVKRGEWIDAGQYPFDRCSICGDWVNPYEDDYNFCPNCGADMRGE